MDAHPMNQSLLGALDIGGTKIAASVADESGPLARVTAPTPKSGPPDTLARECIALLHAACDQAGVPRQALHAVGVSAAGPFAQQTLLGSVTILAVVLDRYTNRRTGKPA